MIAKYKAFFKARMVKWTPVFGPLVKVDRGGLELSDCEGISWPPQEVIDGTYSASF
jgi:hypothetical protein